jgi:hypothetical protein
MIEILIEYRFDEFNYENITITMIHGDDPVAQIMFKGHWRVERKFIKYTTIYEKFSTYEIPSMKLHKYGWGLSCNHKMVGPAVKWNIRGQWEVDICGIIGGSEHDINFDNFGLVWVEMLEDYRQMKIDVKRLNSQK